MASPTPTSDPVTASPTPPVSDPIVASDRPDKPIMGNIVSLSRDDWSAWTGGKPAPGWVGLDPSAADDITSPNQLRPVHASASQRVQLSSYRHDDPIYPSEQSRRLPERRLGPSRRLWDGYHRLSPDPESSSVMTNVVRSHSATPSRQQRLSAPSRFFIKEKMDDDDSFHVVWLQLIKTIQSTSIERFEDLKAAIKARHPSQYAGENQALAADYRKDARELTTAGQYDHNLTLTMLKTFLWPEERKRRLPLSSPFDEAAT
ncbi:hypothetical protein MHU86_6276 [Fragilaria crotonensis]|nr:hypothetical protein MHU86_6276 [Fragilaria crotonensis]